jgi:hypothetical protein
MFLIVIIPIWLIIAFAICYFIGILTRKNKDEVLGTTLSRGLKYGGVLILTLSVVAGAIYWYKEHTPTAIINTIKLPSTLTSLSPTINFEINNAMGDKCSIDFLIQSEGELLQKESVSLLPPYKDTQWGSKEDTPFLTISFNPKVLGLINQGKQEFDLKIEIKHKGSNLLTKEAFFRAY